MAPIFSRPRNYWSPLAGPALAGVCGWLALTPFWEGEHFSFGYEEGEEAPLLSAQELLSCPNFLCSYRKLFFLLPTENVIQILQNPHFLCLSHMSRML